MANHKMTLAFEIGTEEIPAFDLKNATIQLNSLLPSSLESARIPFDSIEVFSTPRRMIMIVKGLAQHTEALTEEHKGPSIAIAYDDKGEPTKAASGFARSRGVSTDELERRTLGDTEYVYAIKNVPAVEVRELLPSILENLIESIDWPKSCRWASRSETFSRPVRWLLALLDDKVIPVRFAGLEASNMTRGHRFLSPGPHRIDTAEALIPCLENAYVVPNQDRRESLIRQGVSAIEKESGAHAHLPEKTLTEVINLTEYPTALMGTFDESFLEVPEEIIVDAMLVHQRYFPLYKDDKLSNRFIAVSNGDPQHSQIIINGNERVIRPRLADAKFFYEEDLKHPLEYYVSHLDEVIFQETLGTMKAKTDRIVALTKHLSQDAVLSDKDNEDALRAAYLSKADLVTNAVKEFTSVQGIMGSYYAKASGENDVVASAIADQYRPKFAGDEPPSSDVGKVVAIADKLDTICGLFAIGQAPTGSSDPFALRRGAIGIVNMLVEGFPISLVSAVKASLATYESLDFNVESNLDEILDFFVTRTNVMLRDKNTSVDLIDAVLAVGSKEPAEIVERVKALENMRDERQETMDNLATAYARANNLRDSSLGISVDESLMGEAESELFMTIQKVEADVAAYLMSNEYPEALLALATLRTPIDHFFEEVLIMDEDKALKENRLRLLNYFIGAFAQVADFGKMAKSGK